MDGRRLSSFLSEGFRILVGRAEALRVPPFETMTTKTVAVLFPDRRDSQSLGPLRNVLTS
jgi:hypothetical protein